MLNRTSNPKYKAFDLRITDREFNVFMDLFEVFMSTCEANNITYLLLGGTLLGWRCSVPVPLSSVLKVAPVLKSNITLIWQSIIISYATIARLTNLETLDASYSDDNVTFIVHFDVK